MAKTLAEEVYPYFLTKSPLRFSNIFELMRNYEELEKDITKKFNGGKLL